MRTASVLIKVKPQFIYQLTAIKRDARGAEVSRRASERCPNVFTNGGVNTLLGGSVPDIAAVVGTGSSAPDIEQSHLDTFLSGAYTSGSVNRSFVDNGDGTGYIEVHKNTLFAVGVATGNISEVGATFGQSPPNSSTELMSRALVVDANGDPSVFEVLEDEELLLTKIFRIHLNLQDVVITGVPVDGDGPNQTITIRPRALGSVNSFWQWPRSTAFPSGNRIYYGESYNLPGILQTNGNATGAGSGSTGITQSGGSGGIDAYVANSKQRSAWARLGTGSERNIVGVELDFNWSVWAIKLSPGIPKSALHRFTIGVILSVDNTP